MTATALPLEQDPVLAACFRYVTRHPTPARFVEVVKAAVAQCTTATLAQWFDFQEKTMLAWAEGQGLPDIAAQRAFVGALGIFVQAGRDATLGCTLAALDAFTLHEEFGHPCPNGAVWPSEETFERAQAWVKELCAHFEHETLPIRPFITIGHSMSLNESEVTFEFWGDLGKVTVDVHARRLVALHVHGRGTPGGPVVDETEAAPAAVAAMLRTIGEPDDT